MRGGHRDNKLAVLAFGAFYGDLSSQEIEDGLYEIQAEASTFFIAAAGFIYLVKPVENKG